MCGNQTVVSLISFKSQKRLQANKGAFIASAGSKQVQAILSSDRNLALPATFKAKLVNV